MYVAITILIILVCIVLILAVLVQNPKGGGLSASFGGMGNQVMGAQKASDFIEKTTWILAVSLIVLSIFSGVAMPKKGDTADRKTELENSLMTPGVPADQSPNTVPMPEEQNTTPANPE